MSFKVFNSGTKNACSPYLNTALDAFSYLVTEQLNAIGKKKKRHSDRTVYTENLMASTKKLYTVIKMSGKCAKYKSNGQK